MAEPFIGEIRMFCSDYAPQNWASCNGQMLAIEQQTSLFSVIYINFGGDGRVTFRLPNFKGRLAMGAGTGPGLTPRNIGSCPGVEHLELEANHLKHSHPMRGSTMNDSATDPTDKLLGIPSGGQQPYATTATKTSYLHDDTISSASGDHGSHLNIMPYQSVNYIICLVGNYPPHDN